MAASRVNSLLTEPGGKGGGCNYPEPQPIINATSRRGVTGESLKSASSAEAAGVSIGVSIVVSTGVSTGISIRVSVGVSFGVSAGVSIRISTEVSIGVCVGVSVGDSVAVSVSSGWCFGSGTRCRFLESF